MEKETVMASEERMENDREFLKNPATTQEEKDRKLEYLAHCIKRIVNKKECFAKLVQIGTPEVYLANEKRIFCNYIDEIKFIIENF